MDLKKLVEVELATELKQRRHPKFGRNNYPSQNTSDTLKGIQIAGKDPRSK